VYGLYLGIESRKELGGGYGSGSRGLGLILLSFLRRRSVESCTDLTQGSFQLITDLNL
jgi:hypothetical protein